MKWGRREAVMVWACGTLTFQAGGAPAPSYSLRLPFLGPEVIQEAGGQQEAALWPQLGTLFLIPEAREKVITTRTSPLRMHLPWTDRTIWPLSGPPEKKAFAFLHNSYCGASLMGLSHILYLLRLALLSTVREDGGGEGGCFG